MRPVSHVPTLMLTHVQFYEDCTVGVLSDKEGKTLCMTLEPRWHKGSGHDHVLSACLSEGDYPLSFHYDATLHYSCWHLKPLKAKHKVRLCFHTKDGSVAVHTKGDLLLGYLSPEGDEECPFEGRLYRPVEAFERLLDYYYSLRANHADFRLQVEPTQESVTILPAVEAPQLRPEQFHFEDYILQTL